MNEKQLFKSTWTKWAMILGVGSMVFSIILSLLGLFGNQKVGWLSFIISAVVIVLAFKSYKEANGGYLKLGRGVGMAALIGLLGGVISTALLIGYMALDSSMMDQMLDNQMDAAMERIEAQGMEMDEETLRANMNSDMVKTITYVSIAVVGPIGSLVVCVLIGLVAGAVMKNNPPEGYQEGMIDETGGDS